MSMGLVIGIRNPEGRERAGLGSGSSALLPLENRRKKIDMWGKGKLLDVMGLDGLSLVAA